MHSCAKSNVTARPLRKSCVAKITKSKTPNLKPSRLTTASRHVTRSPHDNYAQNQSQSCQCPSEHGSKNRAGQNALRSERVPSWIELVRDFKLCTRRTS